MKTATFVRKVTEERTLYRLNSPVDVPFRDDLIPVRYVIVSAVEVLGVPETFIFPAKETGIVLSWVELSGSFRGGLDPDQALARAGYRTIYPTTTTEKERVPPHGSLWQLTLTDGRAVNALADSVGDFCFVVPWEDGTHLIEYGSDLVYSKKRIDI